MKKPTTSSSFRFSRGDIVKRAVKRASDKLSPLDRYIVLGNFKTTRTGANRTIVEPIAIPGLYLIQAESSLEKSSVSFLSSWLFCPHRRNRSASKKNNVDSSTTGFSEKEKTLLEDQMPLTAYKNTGSYFATGKIIGFFEGRNGSRHYVFEFETPSGLLHIFREKQIVIDKEKTHESHRMP